MRKLSLWARRHPRLARLCIILLYIPINITGLITGDLLFDLGVQLAGSFLIAAMAVFVIAVFFYPNRNAAINTSKQALNLRRKTSDLVLISATFGMICFTGNQINVAIPFYPLATKIAGYSPASHDTFLKETTGPASGGPVSNKKAVRKQLRHLMQEFRRSYKGNPEGEKIALIALTLIVATSLVGLLAALACSIACAGSEALSYFVFFGGTIAIGFLTYFILHRLINGRPKSKPRTAPVGSS